MDDIHSHPNVIAFKDEYSLIGEKPPSTPIFQYTVSSTLKSLLSSNVVWATEHKYLNDPTEFSHGMQYFVEKMEPFLKAIIPNDYFKLIKLFLDQSSNPDFKIFISSFTESKDLLSQWRGYGDYGRGLSIGFDPKEFILEEDRSSFWIKVIYDDKIKKRIVNKIFADLGVCFNNLKQNLPASTSDAQIIRALILALLQVSVINSIRFKDIAWHEEKEWRLVKLYFNKKNKKPVNVRARDHELIEYFEFDFKNDTIGALSEIVIGPRSNNLNQRSALETLLTNGRVRITDSRIPWV